MSDEPQAAASPLRAAVRRARQLLDEVEAAARGAAPAEVSAAVLDAVEQLELALGGADITTPARVGREPADAPASRYRQLFELAPDPYLLTDTDGVVRLANERAVQLFATTRELIEGHRLTTFVHPEDHSSLQRRVDRAGAGHGTHGWEVRLVDSATETLVLASVEPARDPQGGTELRWVLTDAMPVVLTRRTHQRLLDDSRGDTASLRAATEWQATLLGAAATDLRTPLAVISSSIETLLDDDGSITRDVAHVMLERVARQAMKMRRLLPTLLQSSRLQLRSGTPTRRRVHLAELCDLVLHDLDVTEHEFIHQHETPTVHVDPALLQRVLLELLTNATEHAPRGSVVNIGSVRRGVDVELYVDDTGPAVPLDARDELFSPFSRISRRTPTPDGDVGDGPGLALLSTFARLHGGRAWVQDAPAGGASFRVLISNALPDEASDPDA